MPEKAKTHRLSQPSAAKVMGKKTPASVSPSNKTTTMSAETDPVVAALKRSPHPYSSISLDPERKYAVTACKDTLQICAVGPFGLRPLKTIPMAAHFAAAPAGAGAHHAASAGQRSRLMGRIHETDTRDSFVSEAFAFGQRHAPEHAANHVINVVITDVTWSGSILDSGRVAGGDNNDNNSSSSSSLIAAAGSNGVIVVWSAATLLQGEGHTVSAAAAPEAVLRKHVRAVNRLAWHPKRPLLLSASQDATVLLWERKPRRATDDNGKSQKKNQQASNSSARLRMLFGGMASGQAASAAARSSFSWQYRARFEPKSEAVRDIRWSPFYDDGTYIPHVNYDIYLCGRFVPSFINSF